MQNPTTHTTNYLPPSGECFCTRLFDLGHGSDCGLIEAARLQAEARKEG